MKGKLQEQNSYFLFLNSIKFYKFMLRYLCTLYTIYVTMRFIHCGMLKIMIISISTF